MIFLITIAFSWLVPDNKASTHLEINGLSSRNSEAFTAVLKEIQNE